MPSNPEGNRFIKPSPRHAARFASWHPDLEYLIAKYFRFKETDASYGVCRPFNHAEIHQTIQRECGHKIFFMPMEFFERLVTFLYYCIDQTVTAVVV